MIFRLFTRTVSRHYHVTMWWAVDCYEAKKGYPEGRLRVGYSGGPLHGLDFWWVFRGLGLSSAAAPGVGWRCERGR